MGDGVDSAVTLFQDILVDLEQDYVDKVDPEKLFKTGIKAMLQSLDPYTEFEDLKSARSMQVHLIYPIRCWSLIPLLLLQMQLL